MSTQQGIVRGDTLQRIASAAFIIGGVLAIVFNILAPRPADPTSFESGLTAMTDRFVLYQLSHLMLALGMWGVMLGSAGVYRSITAGGAAWARLGFYGIVVGTVLWSITFGLTAVGASAAADWAAASAADKGTAYSIVAATLNVGRGAYIMSTLMFWLSLVLLGTGMARSSVYPRWLGWTGVALGIGVVAIVGIPQFFAGTVNTSSMLVFAGLATLTFVWLLVTGMWIARRAW